MPGEWWDETEILATEIPNVLRNRLVHDDFQSEHPRVEVWCQEKAIARYIGDDLAQVACPHARHNPPKINLPVASAPCPLCGGGGWLAAGSAEARQAVTLALLVGRWKGIVIERMGGL